jgi:hypothetical protein
MKNSYLLITDSNFIFTSVTITYSDNQRNNGVDLMWNVVIYFIILKIKYTNWHKVKAVGLPPEMIMFISLKNNRIKHFK